MEKGLFCTMRGGCYIMGKLISLVQQPVLEHPAMDLHSGCSREVCSMAQPQWAAFVKAQCLT